MRHCRDSWLANSGTVEEEKERERDRISATLEGSIVSG